MVSKKNTRTLVYMQFLLYLCSMFRIIRQYAPMLLVVMMSLFVMSLVMDEYSDSRRIAEDLHIESCMELETEDYEWDELDLSSQPVYAGGLSVMYISLPFREGQGLGSAPYLSDKQRLGLVRRYAPRKAFVCYHYAPA